MFISGSKKKTPTIHSPTNLSLFTSRFEEQKIKWPPFVIEFNSMRLETRDGMCKIWYGDIERVLRWDTGYRDIFMPNFRIS
jgi:hypothetical protein